MSGKVLLGYILFLAFIFLPQLALADEVDAREHFRRGTAAYQRGDYALAIREWKTAYDASQKPRMQYNLAQAYERLGKLSEAIAALQRYLESADPDDAAQSDAAARLSALERRMAATGIKIQGGPDGAAITIDDKNWGFTPRPDKITLSPGSHSITIRAEGYDEFVSNVIIPPGQVLEVTVEMKENGLAEAPIRPIKDDSFKKGDNQPGPHREQAQLNDEMSSSGSIPLYIVSGALAASAIGSGIWMIDRMKAASDCDNPPEGARCDNQDSISTQNTIAISTTIALGVGAVGVLLYAILSEDSDTDKKTSAVDCLSKLALGTQCVMQF